MQFVQEAALLPAAASTGFPPAAGRHPGPGLASQARLHLEGQTSSLNYLQNYGNSNEKMDFSTFDLEEQRLPTRCGPWLMGSSLSPQQPRPCCSKSLF